MNKVYSDFYLNHQLNIDKALIQFRFKSEKNFFHGTSCLEMGPADGVMTTLLAGEFDSLHIVDGDEKLLNIIPDFSNLSKFHAWFEEFTPPQKYDTIILEHILEHVDNPEIIVSRACSWLNNDGVMIIGVPNAKSIHRLAAVKMGLLKSEYELNARDLSQGHKRVFDMKSLKEVVEKMHETEIIFSGGVFLKPLSNKQIEDHWTPEMIQAFYELGEVLNENTADIFIVAKKK